MTRGPAPKPAAQRRRRNKTSTKAQLPAEGRTGPVPDLPDGEWSPLTVDWWQSVWASPMATEFLDTDYQELVRVAMLVEMFAREPSRDLAAELRLQAARFGLSPIDRRRLDWEVAKSDDAAAVKSGGTVHRLRAVDSSGL